MNREQLQYITDTHYRRLKKRSAKIAESFDPEAIHQFRVEYKKLRAFLRALMWNERTAVEIKAGRNLKKAFIISGSIRDLQLQQERVKAVTEAEPQRPQSYLNLLEKEVEKLKPELFEILSGHPVAESKKKTDPGLPDLFQLTSFQYFVAKQWASIRATLASGYFSDERIHGIRKILKDLFYNLEKYGGPEHTLLSVSVAVMRGKDISYYTQLLEELGNFQDQCNAIALVKSYWLTRLNSHDRELMERVKKNWIKDKITMKQLLLRKLTADLANILTGRSAFLPSWSFT